MPTKRKQASVRKPRSDAQRNRERILEVAKEAFTRSGAKTSLDDIARDAGVGPGTLYRHFPAREQLLEAVYRTEMERLASAGQKFAEDLPPIEALRAWLLLFVDYIAAKQLIAPALNMLLGDPKTLLFETSYARIREAIRGERDIQVDILNYKKDGGTFWNALYLSPTRNEKGELQYFFASQLDVTDRIAKARTALSGSRTLSAGPPAVGMTSNMTKILPGQVGSSEGVLVLQPVVSGQAEISVAH